MLKNNIDINIDTIDVKIIDLMVLNKTNKEISKDLRIPLSTIQRRARALITAGYVVYNIEVNIQMLGFKTGLVHVNLRDGNIEETAKKMQNLNQITGVEIHIGNSDILGNVIYNEEKELLNLIADIKKMQGVERALWSERVYQSPPKDKENMVHILSGLTDQ
jgi:DNA-binding Lrp family transcriptional regulator